MAATDARIEEVERFLNKHVTKITDGRTLPYIPVEQIIREVVLCCMAQEEIAKCSLPSLGSAARQAYLCQLSLDQVLGQAYLWPKGGHVKFDRMYKGLLDLAYRSDKVLVIRAYTVYQGDDFDCDLGTQKFIRYKPNQRATAADRVWETVVCAYAVAELAGGATLPDVVWRPELEELRDNALKKNRRPDNPWKRFIDAMCKSRPAKRVCSYVPGNPFLGYALGLEGLDEAGKLPDIDPAFADTHDKPIPTGLSGLSERVGTAEPFTSGGDRDERPPEAPLEDDGAERGRLVVKILTLAKRPGLETQLRNWLCDDDTDLAALLARQDLNRLCDLAAGLEG